MVELTREHVRFAVGIARRISHSDPAMCESDALFALLKASRTYRAGVGTFRGYAAPRIVWAVQDGLRTIDHLSRSRRHEVTAGAADAGPPSSLDALIDLEEGKSSLRVNAPINSLLLAEPEPDTDAATRITVQDALAALDSRAGLVVRLRYHGWHHTDIEAFLGVTESRVCQLYRAGLLELRAALGIDSAEELLAA